MHATDVIETNIAPACQSMHRVRLSALTEGIRAALAGKCVTVTALGRRSPREGVSEKSLIKQMDRLIGNPHLVAEARMVYGAMARWLLPLGIERPLILIDWSPVSVDGKYHVLRASVPSDGRGRTLYEEVHPQAKYAGREVQRCFLERLATLIPEGCRPTIVTDAGFKNPWFRDVESLGWDWIGRIRGTVQLARPEEDYWMNAKLLGFLLETDKPTVLGEFRLAKSNPVKCMLYGLRKPPKGRFDKNRQGRRSQAGTSRKNAARGREPWLIATSLEESTADIQSVLAAYAKRMQIEEGFRDTKDEYYGLGLNRARSRSAERFTVLLLINALALFVAWLTGKVAEMRKVHHRYQANTVRHRRVLSCVFLGLRVLSRAPLQITASEIRQVLQGLENDLQLGSTP